MLRAARALETPMRAQHSRAVAEAMLATMQAEDAEGSEHFAVGAAAVFAELGRVADACAAFPEWSDKGHERLATHAQASVADMSRGAHQGNLCGTA